MWISLPGQQLRSRCPGDPRTAVTFQRPWGGSHHRSRGSCLPRVTDSAPQPPPPSGVALWLSCGPQIGQTHGRNLCVVLTPSPQRPLREALDRAEIPHGPRTGARRDPFCGKHRLALPHPPQHPGPSMGRYRRRLILTRACGGDQTHLGWTASRERQQTAGRQSGLSPGCALLPAALPGLEELGTSPGPQETCQGHLLSPDDPSPRSLCCPAPAECCRQLENLALLLPSERSLLSLVCAHTLRSHLSDSNRRAGGASSSGLGCWEAEAPGVNSSPAAESSARVFGQHAAYSTEKKPEANSTISRF